MIKKTNIRLLLGSVFLTAALAGGCGGYSSPNKAPAAPGAPTQAPTPAPAPAYP